MKILQHGNWRRILPIGILLLLVVFLGIGLQYDPRKLPSAKIGKPVPSFVLPALDETQPPFSPENLRGKFWVLNVFASWCAACVTENSSLIKFGQLPDITLVGLAYKDATADTKAWLQQFGNPYRMIAQDQQGDIGIDLGVYGVPETFIISPEGIILYRHVGPVDDDFYVQHYRPAVSKASATIANPPKSEVQKAIKNAPSDAAPTIEISEAEVDKRLRALAAELRCLVCQNQTILDSNAPLAIDLKRQVVEQIHAGKSDKEIKAYMLERYGEFVLYKPPVDSNILLWTLPFLALVIGIIIFVVLSRRPVGSQQGSLPQPSKARLKELDKMYKQSN